MAGLPTVCLTVSPSSRLQDLAEGESGLCAEATSVEALAVTGGCAHVLSSQQQESAEARFWAPGGLRAVWPVS